jgi:hypothetical protein
LTLDHGRIQEILRGLDRAAPLNVKRAELRQLVGAWLVVNARTIDKVPLSPADAAREPRRLTG